MIKVQTKTRIFTMTLNDEESEELFKDIVRKLLWNEQEEKKEQAIKNTGTGSITKPLPKEDGQEMTEKSGEEDGKRRISYKGFLHIKCSNCGKENSYCKKEPETVHTCSECGEKTELEDMVPVYVNCECGKYFKYMTNRKEPVFEIDCLECGQPVAVKYNVKKNIYETIKTEY